MYAFYIYIVKKNIDIQEEANVLVETAIFHLETGLVALRDLSENHARQIFSVTPIEIMFAIQSQHKCHVMCSIVVFVVRTTLRSAFTHACSVRTVCV